VFGEDAGLDIIRAEGAFGSWFVEGKTELSCEGGTLEFAAEVPEVFRADLELLYFLDHRSEVSQRPNPTERRSIGRSRRSPRRREYQRILNCAERHAAVVQLRRKRTIRASNHADCAGRCPISFQNLPHILALLHRPTPSALRIAQRRTVDGDRVAVMPHTTKQRLDH
jgi:hypothetical protein